MYSEEVLRQVPCYHCVHCIGSKELKRIAFSKRKCELTNRWGSMDKAWYCMEFKNRQVESLSDEVHGHRIRKDQVEDYRTEKQWLASGFQVKSGATGTAMYASRLSACNNGPVFTYFLPEQVEKIK